MKASWPPSDRQWKRWNNTLTRLLDDVEDAAALMDPEDVAELLEDGSPVSQWYGQLIQAQTFALDNLRGKR